MKFRFFDIDSIQAVWDGRSYIEVDGLMTERDRIEAMERLWEYIGDEALIERLKLDGFEVRRIEEPSLVNEGAKQ